jgi:hypothetical protein
MAKPRGSNKGGPARSPKQLRNVIQNKNQTITTLRGKVKDFRTAYGPLGAEAAPTAADSGLKVGPWENLDLAGGFAKASFDLADEESQGKKGKGKKGPKKGKARGASTRKGDLGRPVRPGRPRRQLASKGK